MDQTSAWLISITLGVCLLASGIFLVNRQGSTIASRPTTIVHEAERHDYLNEFTQKWVSDPLKAPEPLPVPQEVAINPFLKNVDLWSYSGRVGPTYWSDVSDEYSLCTKGRKQSPVNISNPRRVGNLSGLKFYYHAIETALLNTSHTLLAPIPDGNYVVFAGERYNLLEFHFHQPSEHQVDDIAYDMEMHFVHRTEGDRYLNLAVFIDDTSKTHAELEKLWKNLPKTKGDSGDKADIDLIKLLPNNRNSYYVYDGSLCSPPCSEGVQWIVFTHSISLSASQVDRYTKVFARNARPLQGLFGRQIKLSER